METTVKAVSNWTLIGGDDITKTIQAKVTNEDIFIKPPLGEIVSEERAILLSQPPSIRTGTDCHPCEFLIRVFPRYKIESLSFVCSAPKVEIFTGLEKEYNETIYGSAIEDEVEPDSLAESMNAPRSYRYDIEITKSGINEIMLKLLSTTQEICCFGIILNIAPNPNGITTLLPNAINLDNVQRMLQTSNVKLSPNAEKCKMFMQMYRSAQQPVISTSIAEDRPNVQANPAVTMKPQPSNITADLQTYIDIRFAELETKLLKQLAGYGASQSAKLDKILSLLERR